MKPVTIVAFSVGLLVAGCSRVPTSMPPSRKAALQELFDAHFVFASVPAQHEDDLYRLLELFAIDRGSDELVRSVEFTSDFEATLHFSDHGMHGGGVVVMKKEAGKWRVDEKLYFL